MKAEIQWLTDPTVFRVNRLDAHSDHVCYASPEEAARRELWEESGAESFTLQPVCGYWAADDEWDKGAVGMVFLAEIRGLGPLPEKEMAETRLFDALPENLTYPDITPRLWERLAGSGLWSHCE